MIFPTTIGVIIVIAVVALILWLVPNVDATLKKLLIAVAVIVTVVWAIYVAVNLLRDTPSGTTHERVIIRS